MRSVFLGAALAAVLGGAASAQICTPQDHGGLPNDALADTAAIQAAIDACKDRGGTVRLAGGRFIAATLRLGSDMTFQIAPGATLAALPDIGAYPEIDDLAVDGGAAGQSAGDGYDRFRALVVALGVRNLVIEGPGRLDGQGPLFWDPGFLETSASRPTLPRPQQMLELADCQNVTVRDLTLVDSPAYSIRFNRCTGVRAENITVRNHPRSPNTDGIQIRDTSNAFIRGADIDTGDDAIVVKSQLRVVDNLVVTDSILKSDDSAIKFGTAGYAGITNSLFSNIIIRESRFGIALFQMDGGAYRNARFENISLQTGGRGPRHYAVYVDLDRRTPSSPLGVIEGLSFSGVRTTTSANWLIAGQRNALIRDVVIEDSEIRIPSGAIDLTRTTRKPRGNVLVAAQAATSEDYSAINAQLTLANISGLRVEGLRVRNGDPAQTRMPVWLKNVTDAAVQGLDVVDPTLRPGSALVTADGAAPRVSDALGPAGARPLRMLR